MGSAISCPSSNDQHTGSKFLFGKTDPDKSCSGHAIVDSDKVENDVKDAPSYISSAVIDFDDLEVVQLGIVITDSLNICDSLGCDACNVSTSYEDVNVEHNETKHILHYAEYQSGTDSSSDLDESSDRNELKLAGLHTNGSEHFYDTETLESLDEAQVFPSVLDEIAQLNAKSSAESTTAKPVSALKGSRAQRGLPVTKLSVKWAPDVYDPPSTSGSHTVKGHHRRTKSTKEYSKHKNGKSKSLRRGVAEKKLASRRSSNFVDSRTPRCGVAKGVKVNDSPSQSLIPVLDYTPQK